MPQSNFALAFFFLSKERREALNSVYDYCRLVDDIVDEEGPEAEKRRALDAWRRELERVFGAGQPEHPVALRLQRARERFPLRHADALAVLEGCEMDLLHTRYRTFADLRAYCYRVASAVGLLCIEIFGYREPRTRDYAVDLGLALQLTNILRDVGEDARRGRIYLPLSDLDAFSVAEQEVLDGRRSDRLLRLLRHSGERARTHYLRARAALPASDRRSMAAAEIMGDIYHAILQEIGRGGYDVLGARRVSLAPGRKLAIALCAFGRSYLALKV